jgi:hypothetical protein
MLKQNKILFIGFMFTFLFFGNVFANWPVWNGQDAVNDIIAPGMTSYGDYQYDLVQESLKSKDRKKIQQIKKDEKDFGISLSPKHKGSKFDRTERIYVLKFIFNDGDPLEIDVKIKREPVQEESKGVIQYIVELEEHVEAFAENLIHGILGRFIKDPIEEEMDLVESFFDKENYRAQYGVRRDRLRHFVTKGWEEGCNPNTWFDVKLYQQYFHCDGNPFVDWLQQDKGTKYKLLGDKLVVSLTSHPGRINTAYLSIESILRQSKKPQHIVLYLASEDFPGGLDNANIPQSLRLLEKRGLEIKFSDINYKSAIKLIPALRDFPGATIVTIDDDRLYRPDLLKSLWAQHQKYPQEIISPSARHYIFDEIKGIFEYLAHILESLFYDVCNFGIFEGFSGVLYPANALDNEVYDLRRFLKYASCADDLWFQTMAIKKGTKVRGLPQEINEKFHLPIEIEGTQEVGLFHQHLNKNTKMLNRLLRRYKLLETVKASSNVINQDE